MKEPTLHPEEQARQAALDALAHVYSPAEKRFDNITEAAKKAFGVPIVLVSLIHEDKQWFKSAQGIAVPETDRCISFCGHAILQDDIFQIPDATQDPRFADNPLVTNDPNIRFYAGIPVRAKNGLPLGTLCLIDTKTRELDIFQRKQLQALAEWLERELQNRGMSSRELEHLRAQAGNEDDDWVDPATKCWNLEAGTTLLAGMLEQARAAGRPITVGAFQVQLENTDLSELDPSGLADEIRLELANAVRAKFPEQATLFATPPDRVYFASPRPGRLDAVPDPMNVGRRLRRALEDRGIDVRTRLRGAVTEVSDADGRQRTNLIKRIQRELEAARPQELRSFSFW